MLGKAGGRVRRAVGLLMVLLASGCVAPREAAPPPPPAPRPAPTPAPAPPPPATDWRDRAYSPGDWSYARAGAASEAAYGAPGTPLFTLRCEPVVRQVRLGWSGAPAGALTIRTTYGDTLRAALPAPEGAQLVMSAGDPLLDQLAYSRGRFMLASGAQELILPAWPEVARVVEDCR
jgi:hypothetical protein